MTAPSSEPVPQGTLPDLAWFREQRGERVPWAQVKGGDTGRASSAKAIFKPRGQPYALSVKIMAGGRYPNIGPLVRPDGSWCAGYHQEGDDPDARDNAWTNLAVMANIRDRQPLGVLRQTAPGTAEYDVLGLALPVDWVDGLFLLEGPDPGGRLQARAGAYQELLLSAGGAGGAGDGAPHQLAAEPVPWFDARARAVRSVVRRQGQGAFRTGLLQAYSGRCAVTGCSAPEVLDAAHIDPYLGPHSNTTDNGLMLRADLHALFDLGLLAFDPATRQTRLAPALLHTEYASLHGRVLTEPAPPHPRPGTERLLRRVAAAAPLAALPPSPAEAAAARSARPAPPAPLPEPEPPAQAFPLLSRPAAGRPREAR